MNWIEGLVQAVPDWVAGLDPKGVTIVIVALSSATVIGSIILIRLSGKRR